ncbi:MAG: sugar transferase [bacterium]|nr:sugar transferase [bacterium]
MKKSELLFSAILVPVDYIMVFVAGLLAYNLRFVSFFTDIRPVFFEINFQQYMMALFIVPVIFILIFAMAGLYQIKITRRIMREMSTVFVATCASVAIVIIIIFFQRELFSSRFIILIGWLLAIVFVMIGRALVRGIQRSFLKRGVGIHHEIIIGNDSTTEDIIKQIHKFPYLGYKVVTRFKSFNEESKKQIIEIINTGHVDEIIQADTNLPKEEALAIKWFCNDHHLVFKYATDLFEVQPNHIEINTIAGIPIIEVKRTKLDGWGRIFKRFFDIVGSLILLIILLPLFIIIALLISIDSQGGVFVKLPRVGEKGKLFKLYKFRSMVKNAQSLKKELLEKNERNDGPLFKIKDDPRITRVGKFIRKTSIDELPQFFNVFRGEMSLVGPRPHEPEEVDKYERRHRKLLVIKPGVTGMAQISGRSDLKFDEEAKLDIYYIENWTPEMDLQILIKTPWVVLTGRSAS